MTTKLDDGPLERAIASLGAAMARADAAPDDDVVRDACIQRFGSAYELCHKMLKRYLEATSANPAQFGAMPFQDLIRTGSQQGLLLGDWTSWKEFRVARSITSHTYDERKACDVFAAIPAFVREARFLRDRLRGAPT